MPNIRYAVRTLTRTPGFTLTAVLTLALGIGATTAMMTVLDGVLIKPLPYGDPERLYLATTVITSATGNTPDAARQFPVNAHHFSIWREQCQTCANVALVGSQGFTLTGAGGAERLIGLQVSSNLFHALGVRPQIGRDFTLDDEGPGRSPVVLLSVMLWRSHFNADPSIVGRSILLDGIAECRHRRDAAGDAAPPHGTVGAGVWTGSRAGDLSPDWYQHVRHPSDGKFQLRRRDPPQAGHVDTEWAKDLRRATLSKPRPPLRAVRSAASPASRRRRHSARHGGAMAVMGRR